MTRIAIALLLITVATAPAHDAVAVPGTDLAFVPRVQQTAHGKKVDLCITGTALRTKTLLNVKVYGMASYAQDVSAIKTGEDLAAAEQVKLLHLIMERKVSGTDFVNAFRDAVGSDRANGEFAAEFAKLKEVVGNASADKGDHVLLLYVPDAGTRIRIGDAVDATIPGQAFGRAIWETYLGKKPIDDDIKKNLMRQIAK